MIILLIHGYCASDCSNLRKGQALDLMRCFFLVVILYNEIFLVTKLLKQVYIHTSSILLIFL